MSVDNLNDNFRLIEKGKRWNYYYFVIETEKNIEIDINITNMGYIFNLDHLNWQLTESFQCKKYQNEKLEKTRTLDSLDQIKYLTQSNTNDLKSSIFFLLILKIVDLSQPSTNPLSSKLSEVIDPEIGMSVSYREICLDFINLLSFYFQASFSIRFEIFYLKEDIELSIIKSEYLPISENRLGRELTKNLTLLCDLRVEQFKLIQKSLVKVNQSFKVVNYDITLALILFLSALENLAQKYGEKGSFNSKINFYNSLRTIIFKKKADLLVNNEVRNELFDEIGNGFMKTTHTQAMLKFKSFCLKFFPFAVRNEKSDELLSDLYYIRSKFLHAGERFEIRNRGEPFYFNEFVKQGLKKKTKTIMTGQGRRSVRIARIPSYNVLLAIFTQILQNFIIFLQKRKEDQADKDLYKNPEYDNRGVLIASIKSKDKPKKPGMAIFNSDYYQIVDYVDLYNIQTNLIKVDNLIKEKKIDQSQDIIDQILSYPKFSVQYHPFRQAVYIKLDYLYFKKKYNEFLDFFYKFQFDDIVKENFHIFNLKAYCLAEKKKFDEAHEIIDRVLTKAEQNIEKARFFDSKADFYKFAEDFQNAIIYYKKSLQYENDLPFPFHSETQKKLEQCMKY